MNNSNGSVLLNGEIYSLTSTKITTPNGGTIINNTGGLQNVGEDPMLKYTFGNDKFTEFLQESIATRDLAWIDGYTKRDGVEKFTFNNYRDYLRFAYAAVMNYAQNEDTKKEMLSDIAGTSSWYSGKSSERFSSDMSNWINLASAKYDTAPTTPTGSIVSGGAVSIVAKTLNVNGLIQSGFNKYVGNTSPVKISNVYDNASRNLDNDAVIGDKRFRVNDADDEITYNQQTGMYDKATGIYQEAA